MSAAALKFCILARFARMNTNQPKMNRTHRTDARTTVPSWHESRPLQLESDIFPFVSKYTNIDRLRNQSRSVFLLLLHKVLPFPEINTYLHADISFIGAVSMQYLYIFVCLRYPRARSRSRLRPRTSMCPLDSSQSDAAIASRHRSRHRCREWFMSRLLRLAFAPVHAPFPVLRHQPTAAWLPLLLIKLNCHIFGPIGVQKFM